MEVVNQAPPSDEAARDEESSETDFDASKSEGSSMDHSSARLAWRFVTVADSTKRLLGPMPCVALSDSRPPPSASTSDFDRRLLSLRLSY